MFFRFFHFFLWRGGKNDVSGQCVKEFGNLFFLILQWQSRNVHVVDLLLNLVFFKVDCIDFITHTYMIYILFCSVCCIELSVSGWHN